MADWNYVKSESGIRPEEIDTTSSNTTVYIRKNITEESRTDDNGESRTMYVYDEAKVPRLEYFEEMNAINEAENRRNRADIEFIAMMTDVELD